MVWTVWVWFDGSTEQYNATVEPVGTVNEEESIGYIRKPSLYPLPFADPLIRC